MIKTTKEALTMMILSAIAATSAENVCGQNAYPLLEDKIAVKTGGVTEANILIFNSDANTEIDRISYEWKAGGKSGVGEYTFRTPIANYRGAFGVARISLKGMEESGTAPLSITITKVNGEENLSNKKEGTCVMISTPVVPQKLPLVDEYTGLWCPTCPLGYVAVETMAEDYGNKFVAAVWHYNDDMAIGIPFPTNVSTYPDGAIDRGGLQAVNTLSDTWEEHSTFYSPVDIQVDLRYKAEDSDMIEATAKLTWIEAAAQGEYELGFILTADDLSNPEWRQANNYVGSTSLVGKYAELFTRGSRYVTGLKFNHIVVAADYPQDYEGGELGRMEELKEYSITREYSVVRKISSGEVLVKDGSKLRVIAYVVDKQSGNIVNCGKSGAPEMAESGIATLEDEVVKKEYYDLQGRRVSEWSEGILIERVEYASGRISTKKTIR